MNEGVFNQSEECQLLTYISIYLFVESEEKKKKQKDINEE